MISGVKAWGRGANWNLLSKIQNLGLEMGQFRGKIEILSNHIISSVRNLQMHVG